MSQFFTSGGQSIGASASTLPVSIQGWFPLGWTGFVASLSHPYTYHPHMNVISIFVFWAYMWWKFEKCTFLATFKQCNTILWTKFTCCTLIYFKTRSVLRPCTHCTPVYLVSSWAKFPFTPVLSGLQRADRCLMCSLYHLPHTNTWFFHWVYLYKDIKV